MKAGAGGPLEAHGDGPQQACCPRRPCLLAPVGVVLGSSALLLPHPCAPSLRPSSKVGVSSLCGWPTEAAAGRNALENASIGKHSDTLSIHLVSS